MQVVHSASEVKTIIRYKMYVKCYFYVYSGRGRENSVASVIMMYSPDIPTASPGNTSGDGGRTMFRPASDVGSSAIENYYSRIETEESVKCIVSSVLFFLVLLAFFLVAILINPEM